MKGNPPPNTPYGTPRGTNPTWPNDKGYLGGAQDPTGLTHEGAREYDPTTGRFVSIDPILETNDPQQTGGYAYAANSPITSSDPSGQMIEADGVGGGLPGSGGGGGGGGWLNHAGLFIDGLVHGWDDASDNFGKNTAHAITHPVSTMKAATQDAQKWSDEFGGNTEMGWACALTGLCDAGEKAFKQTQSGDYYGAGYTVGAAAANNAIAIGLGAAIGEAVGAVVGAIARALGGAVEAGADAGAEAATAAGTPKTDPVPPEPTDIGDPAKPVTQPTEAPTNLDPPQPPKPEPEKEPPASRSQLLKSLLALGGLRAAGCQP